MQKLKIRNSDSHTVFSVSLNRTSVRLPKSLGKQLSCQLLSCHESGRHKCKAYVVQGTKPVESILFNPSCELLGSKFGEYFKTCSYVLGEIIYGKSYLTATDITISTKQQNQNTKLICKSICILSMCFVHILQLVSSSTTQLSQSYGPKSCGARSDCGQRIDD